MYLKVLFRNYMVKKETDKINTSFQGFDVKRDSRTGKTNYL